MKLPSDVPASRPPGVPAFPRPCVPASRLSGLPAFRHRARDEQ
jgi:hypothetical protein